ncbi:MAG: DNA polymerase III subunit beta [Anaplasmataceae bacterium]|nr:DNA polymerase III subunit beta [Anaplasmataceae bacterium]
MKLVVIRDNLREAVAAAQRTQGSDNALPILKNFLLEATPGQIKILATNLELAIQFIVSGKVIEPGQVAIPSSAFYELLSNLKSDRLNIELKDRIVSVKTDNYDAKIQCAPTDEFPVIPKISSREQKFVIKGEILKEALGQVAGAAQMSDLRPELSSIFVSYSEEGLKFVATDSFRLAEKTLLGKLFESSFEDKIEFLLPLKTAQEVLRLAKDEEEVSIFRDDYQIVFAGSQWELVSRLSEGTFPNYEAILPTDFKTEAVVSRQNFQEALKVTSVFGSQLNDISLRVLEGGKVIEIFSHNQTLGENRFRLAAKLTSDGLKEAVFNWRYLQDGLKSIVGDDVYIGLSDENKPALLKAPNDDSFFYVIMPILK